MGVDNSTKLIFGMVLSEEQISKIEDKISAKLNSNENSDKNSNEIDIWDGEYTIEEFPQVFLGFSSHYYDASSEHCDHFISLIDPYKTKLSIRELQELFELKNIYTKVLEYFGIEYSEPKLISLVHIW